MRKSELHKEFGYLKIGNKYFKPTVDAERIEYHECTKKQFDAHVKLSNEIVEKIKDSVSKESILLEAVSNLDDEYLEELHNALHNAKRPAKPKMRKHHCLDVKVGRFIIPIIN